ncbi:MULTISPECIES: hypothetical protein [Pyrobaculum]|uniref:Uncharacterized protein n=1 Tax=Pyrobaculum arsenaticum TaxID=121277 RepID=A0A7L4PBQ2_9CREN|nr:hypothetical protein [Pyrobaculum arsenaticum]NYR15877.1 hypothetical protein [Pyrobaculum arsenaticum]
MYLLMELEALLKLREGFHHLKIGAVLVLAKFLTVWTSTPYMHGTVVVSNSVFVVGLAVTLYAVAGKIGEGFCPLTQVTLAYAKWECL